MNKSFSAPKGLICRLIMPLSPETIIDWKTLTTSLMPYVDGFLLDPCFWMRRDYSFLNTNLFQDLLDYLPDEKLILVHISSRSRDITRENIRKWSFILSRNFALDQVMWVDTPLLYHSNRGLPDVYREFSRETSRPFVLENDPKRVSTVKGIGHRSNIRTHVLKILVSNPSIVGLIHHGNLSRALNYSRATRKRHDFSLLDGEEQHYLEYPSTAGLVSITANVCPRGWARVAGQSLKPGRFSGDPQSLYLIISRLKSLSRELGQRPAEAISYLLYRGGLLSPAPSLPERIRNELDALYTLLIKSGEFIV